MATYYGDTGQTWYAYSPLYTYRILTALLYMHMYMLQRIIALERAMSMANHRASNPNPNPNPSPTPFPNPNPNPNPIRCPNSNPNPNPSPALTPSEPWLRSGY